MGIPVFATRPNDSNPVALGSGENVEDAFADEVRRLEPRLRFERRIDREEAVVHGVAEVVEDHLVVREPVEHAFEEHPVVFAALSQLRLDLALLGDLPGHGEHEARRRVGVRAPREPDVRAVAASVAVLEVGHAAALCEGFRRPLGSRAIVGVHEVQPRAREELVIFPTQGPTPRGVEQPEVPSMPATHSRSLA